MATAPARVACRLGLWSLSGIARSPVDNRRDPMEPQREMLYNLAP